MVITFEPESRLEQEVAADSSSLEGVEMSLIVDWNDAEPVGKLKNLPLKAIDVGILKYLKQVHTELYEKLKAAVRSIKKQK